MIAAFKERRAWAVVLVNLLFGPFLGMLYLGRGALSLVYLTISIVWACVVGFFLPADMSHHDLDFFLYCTLPLGVIGAAHGAYLARRRDPGRMLPRYSRWYVFLALIVAPYLLAFGIRTFLFQPFDIPSTSMSPSLNQGDYIFVSKRAYDREPPQRGDIVVFRFHGEDFVKRIAAVPGDRVQMRDGTLLLNGRAVARKRIADFADTDVFGVQRNIARYWETLPSGRSYATLQLSGDAPQDNTEIYAVPPQSYFVLGDNRDNSNDSRLGVGYVARGAIVGKVVVKFADRQHKTMIWAPVD
jgi:signal peptidase I